MIDFCICEYYNYSICRSKKSIRGTYEIRKKNILQKVMGTDAVAANSVANILKNIIACVCNGIGTGAGIIVGNELGKGKLE